MHEPVCDSIDLTYYSEPRRELVARRLLRSHPASADNQNDLIVCAEPTGRGVAGEALTDDVEVSGLERGNWIGPTRARRTPVAGNDEHWRPSAPNP